MKTFTAQEVLDYIQENLVETARGCWEEAKEEFKEEWRDECKKDMDANDKAEYKNNKKEVKRLKLFYQKVNNWYVIQKQSFEESDWLKEIHLLKKKL